MIWNGEKLSPQSGLTKAPGDNPNWSPMLHVQSFTVHLVGQKNITVRAQSLLHRNAGLASDHCHLHQLISCQKTWKFSTKNHDLNSLNIVFFFLFFAKKRWKMQESSTKIIHNNYPASPSTIVISNKKMRHLSTTISIDKCIRASIPSSDLKITCFTSKASTFSWLSPAQCCKTWTGRYHLR